MGRNVVGFVDVDLTEWMWVSKMVHSPIRLWQRSLCREYMMGSICKQVAVGDVGDEMNDGLR